MTKDKALTDLDDVRQALRPLPRERRQFLAASILLSARELSAAQGPYLEGMERLARAMLQADESFALHLYANAVAFGLDAHRLARAEDAWTWNRFLQAAGITP